MLQTSSTNDDLLKVLNSLMKVPSLGPFRLVGGTALSLQLGHRISEDIDLFAAKEYGSIDFKKILIDLKSLFPYLRNDDAIFGLENLENNTGLHLHIGNTEEASIKTDILNWTISQWLDPEKEVEGIRFATIEEIALMKLEVVARGGRKKDFWDLSEIFENISLASLLERYPQKFPFLPIENVKKGLIDFSVADQMPDPICLKGKFWDTVKADMQMYLEKAS